MLALVVSGSNERHCFGERSDGSLCVYQWEMLTFPLCCCLRVQGSGKNQESSVDSCILETGTKGETLDVNADNLFVGGENDFAIER